MFVSFAVPSVGMALLCSAFAGSLPRQAINISGVPSPVVLAAAEDKLHFSYAAYCKSADIYAWSCKWCQKTAKAQNISVNEGVTERDGTASRSFVAIVPEQSEIVVSFRGSSNILNWIENVDFPVVQLKWPGAKAGAKVHNGFLLSYEAIRKDTVAAVKRAQNQCPHCTIHVTGHSLGASQALLGSLDLTLQGIPVSSVYTFGCPRTGDPVFAKWWSETVAPGNSYRAVHNKDIVPHLPAHDFGIKNAFMHTHQELWQTTERGKQVLCNGASSTDPLGEDPQCSYKISLTDSIISDHTAYFGVQASLLNPCQGGTQCKADGTCADSGKASSCCTGRTHATAACINGRCGCLIDGTCATYSGDCCSGKSHKTIRCGGGFTVRCGSASLSNAAYTYVV